MKILKTVKGLLLIGLMSVGLPASAGFLGNTVTANYYWPNGATLLWASGNGVVGAGVEFNNIGGFGVGTSPSVDISDTNILITYPAGFSLAGGAFDGFVIADVLAGIPAITGASLAGTNISGYTASQLTFDADHVYVDQDGFSGFAAGSFISINVSFAQASAVPESETLALMVLALGLLGWSRARAVKA